MRCLVPRPTPSLDLLGASRGVQQVADIGRQMADEGAVPAFQRRNRRAGQGASAWSR